MAIKRKQFRILSCPPEHATLKKSLTLRNQKRICIDFVLTDIHLGKEIFLISHREASSDMRPKHVRTGRKTTDGA